MQRPALPDRLRRMGQVGRWLRSHGAPGRSSSRLYKKIYNAAKNPSVFTFFDSMLCGISTDDVPKKIIESESSTANVKYLLEFIIDNYDIFLTTANKGLVAKLEADPKERRGKIFDARNPGASIEEITQGAVGKAMDTMSNCFISGNPTWLKDPLLSWEYKLIAWKFAHHLVVTKRTPHHLGLYERIQKYNEEFKTILRQLDEI